MGNTTGSTQCCGPTTRPSSDGDAQTHQIISDELDNISLADGTKAESKSVSGGEGELPEGATAKVPCQASALRLDQSTRARAALLTAGSASSLEPEREPETESPACALGPSTPGRQVTSTAGSAPPTRTSMVYRPSPWGNVKLLEQPAGMASSSESQTTPSYSSYFNITVDESSAEEEEPPTEGEDYTSPRKESSAAATGTSATSTRASATSTSVAMKESTQSNQFKASPGSKGAKATQESTNPAKSAKGSNAQTLGKEDASKDKKRKKQPKGDAKAVQLNEDLHACIVDGNINKVKLLVRAKADVNSTLSRGVRSPLHKACRGGNQKIISYLLKEDADVLARTEDLGFSAAHFCVKRAVEGDEASALETVRKLVAAKADVNAVDDNGISPLDKAREADLQQLVDAFTAESRSRGSLFLGQPSTNGPARSSRSPRIK